MARGTTIRVNKAMIRPIMIAGVEKRLSLANALLAFPLVAATHFHIPACFVGIGFYIVMHFVFLMISKNDPHLGKLIKRATRYCFKPYFPAKSHPTMMEVWKIKSVSRPW